MNTALAPSKDAPPLPEGGPWHVTWHLLMFGVPASPWAMSTNPLTLPEAVPAANPFVGPTKANLRATLYPEVS